VKRIQWSKTIHDFRFIGVLLMFVGNNRRLHVLNTGIALYLLVLCLACTAGVKTEDPFSSGRLLAENSILKKRLPLIERENDVLGKENLQYKNKIKELGSRIKQLDLELTALNVKYANDMAAGAETVRNLQQSIENMEKENAARMEQLQTLNTELEKKRVQEVQAITEQIARQKETFKQEREHMVLENAQHASKLSDEIDELNKTIKNKDLELASYKLAIGEISARLGEAMGLAEELRKARDESKAELASVKAANDDLIKKMAAPNPGASGPESQPQADH
jgi:chromosome segregation ATPase